MKYLIFLALVSVVFISPAGAQDPHAGHTMPTTQPPAAPAAADPHSGHQMPPSSDAAHSQHTMPSPDTSDAIGQSPTVAEETVGDAPPPAIVRDSIADQFYNPSEMSRAREILAEEHGGMRISKIMANIFEYAAADEGAGYRWDLEAWHGGDTHRLVFKSEGEDLRSDGATTTEVQALYSRAIGRYTDVQAGVRYDFEPDGRAYATVAIESLLPYWFEVEASLFLSDRGDVLGRLEGSYDLRLTQRLTLQPRLELELAAQDVPKSNIGSGLSTTELGLRLRYDIRREFAPYVGVNFENSFGRTADFARAAGHDPEEISFVVGLHAWF